MIKQNYEMEILVNGKPVQEYFHNNKVYIEGRKDTIFSIRLKNNSIDRVLFVPTIDGLSVLDGENASFNSSGYVVKGRSAITIDSWRISDEQVAEFYFSSVKDSYRKRIGKGNNLGSIAVAVFREKEEIYQLTLPFADMPVKPYTPDTHPWWFNQNSTYSIDLNTSGGGGGGHGYNTMMCAATTQQVGTGFGATKNSAVTSVSFRKEEEPDSLLEIIYNTKEQLNRMGVGLTKHLFISQQNSFPDEIKYCKPPMN